MIKIIQNIIKLNLGILLFFPLFLHTSNAFSAVEVAPATDAEASIVTDTNNTPVVKSGNNKVVSLSFSWNQPVGMAFFQRDGYVWIVFDQRQQVNIDELNKEIEPLGYNVIQIPHTKGTLIRFTPNRDTKFFVRKEGLLWIVDLFTKEAPFKTKNNPIYVKNNSINEPYLFIPNNTVGNTIAFIDPVVGDSIVAVPISEAGMGINTPYSYPDIDFLPAMQGFAIIPISNDLVFNRGNTGLTIQSIDRGLNISPNIDTLKRKSTLTQTSDSVGSLATELPHDLLKKDFTTTVGNLMHEIITSEGEQKTNARADLARYYIGKGMGVEALAVLEGLREDEGDFVKQEKYYGLMAVANFLARRYDKALEELSFGILPTTNEAIMWSAIIKAAKNPEKEHNATIQSLISIMRDYSDEIKEKIALVGVEAALVGFDDIATQHFIDIMKTSNPTPEDKPAVIYYSGRKLSMQGYPRSALKEYRKLIDNPDQKFSSLARYEIAILENKLSALSIKKTIAELEKLRYAWGNNDFKYKLLRSLTDLYVKDGDYYNAINSLHSAYFLASKDEKSLIRSQMITLFEDVFLYNQADNMSALRSLSLYDNYEELAFESKNYEDIVIKLTDRLVAVDLIDRAAKILNRLITTKNLSPETKTKAGTRLALISLFKSDNIEALGILDDTEHKNIDPLLASQRKIIRAKAFTNIGQPERALELLKGDYTKNSLLLKSEIYWADRNWGEVADTLKYLIDKPVPNKTLTNEQINLILDWTTALKQSGRETVILRVRNTFMPYFENTPYYSTFSMLTNTLEKDEIDINAITSAINEIKAFSDFSKLYGNYLKENK